MLKISMSNKVRTYVFYFLNDTYSVLAYVAYNTLTPVKCRQLLQVQSRNDTLILMSLQLVNSYRKWLNFDVAQVAMSL